MLVALLSLGASICASANVEEAYRRRDWFALRDDLGARRSPFYQGIVANRFNQWETSTRRLKEYIAETRPSDGRIADAYETLADNELKQGHYGAAGDRFGDAIRYARAEDGPSLSTVRELCYALRGVRPCTLEKGASACTFKVSVRGGVRKLPITAGDKTVNFLVDTGANLSLVTTKLAKQLGLRIIPTAIRVGTITDAKVFMSLGTIDRIKVGPLTVRNPVFLVLDDKSSPIPMDALGISGILGIPVLAALGEVQFDRDGTVKIDPRGRLANRELCFDGFKPVIRGDVGGKRLPFLLDSGASRTDLYSSFFSEFRDTIREAAAKVQHTMTGVGGSRTVTAWKLHEVTIGLPGGAKAILANVPVSSRSLREEDRFYYGNLGQDVLDRCGSFIINVRRCGVSLLPNK